MKQSALNDICPSDPCPRSSGNPMGVKVERLYEAEGKENTKETRPLNQHEQSSHDLTETKAACPETAGSALGFQFSVFFF